MRIMFLGLTLLGLGISQVFAANLEGSEWGFGNSDKRFIQFQAGGKISGYGGCNRFFGLYFLTPDNELSFSNIASTRMACPDTDMKLEVQFFDILEKAKNLKQDGNLLSIFDDSGALIAELARKDWD